MATKLEGGGGKGMASREKKTFFETREKNIPKKSWPLSLRGGDKALVAGSQKKELFAASLTARTSALVS